MIFATQTDFAKSDCCTLTLSLFYVCIFSSHCPPPPLVFSYNCFLCICVFLSYHCFLSVYVCAFPIIVFCLLASNLFFCLLFFFPLFFVCYFLNPVLSNQIFQISNLENLGQKSNNSK